MPEVKIPDLRPPQHPHVMCVQCRPNKNTVGPAYDFIGDKEFHSPISPLFGDLRPLLDWMHENGWVCDNSQPSGVRRCKNVSEFLYYYAKVGDRITISTPQGGKITGRVVMLNRPNDVLVLNAGGRHGTPALATPENCLKLVRPSERKPKQPKPITDED